MRTEEFKDFDRKLSTINKNFSHGLFLSEQFVVTPQNWTPGKVKTRRYTRSKKRGS